MCLCGAHYVLAVFISTSRMMVDVGGGSAEMWWSAKGALEKRAVRAPLNVSFGLVILK